MKLIVGLGNPGKKYEKTRHNVGFRVVDCIMSNDKCQMTNQIQNPPLRPSKNRDYEGQAKFKLNKQANAEIVEREIDGGKIVLVKPQTFMNESGVAVRKLIADRGVLMINLIVIHDDVDLPFGTIRIKKGGGAGGHHGVESVIEKTGSNDFIRVRIGVGKSDVIPTEDFVLMPFSVEEVKQLPIIIKRAAHVVTGIVTDGLEKAMNMYNQNM